MGYQTKPNNTVGYAFATAFVVALLASAGCHDHAGEGDLTVEEAITEGCGHLKKGPATAATLAVAVTAATSVDWPHKRLDLTFADGFEGKRGGHIKLAVDKASDHVIGLSDDVSLKVLDKDGQALAAKQELSKPTQCAELAVARVYKLTVGSWTLVLGPTDATGVKAIVASLAHDEDAH